MHYDLCRVHQTLRVTHAKTPPTGKLAVVEVAAGLTDRVWEAGELIALMPKPVARAALGFSETLRSRMKVVS